MRIDGYGFAEDEATCDLFVADYRSMPGPSSLTRTDIETITRRAKTFFDSALTPKFAAEIEVTHPAWGLARDLAQRAPAITRVRINLLSDAVLSSAIKELPSKTEDGREWSYQVWDLRAISRLLTDEEPEEIRIDFVEMFSEPLPCLPSGGSGSVDSYLAVIPATWLASIYERYGARLLEQNVRTFLQAKGSVNKGIRRTILEEPGMFFAYNNGISATAAEARLEADGSALMLQSVRHLQIVNGGQTTASIYNVLRKEGGRNLDSVKVQMKLSVVRPDDVVAVVPRIAEYANSQNKVSAADFFSNHPFHVRVEKISRRMWAPAVGGSQAQTHWYYERARGQYANATLYMTPAKKREFDHQNPRKQLIEKTDLAKAEMTFRRFPHVVSSGAQKNFARFAEWVADSWKDDGLEFGDTWFQNAVSKLILFRQLEQGVRRADWYAQGYRAQTVTYTLALLQDRLHEVGRALDLQKIWRMQSLPAELFEFLVAGARRVQDRLIAASAANNVVNVTEWAKRERCWEDMRKHVQLGELARLDAVLESREEAASERRSARKDQRMMNDIEAQTYVVEKGGTYWKALLAWDNSALVLTPSEQKLLRQAALIPSRLPQSFECQKLVAVETKAQREGFKAS
ncbi:AIPR family protein [Thiomonas sp. FB-Cd]|uniref:AIPR family protein n=1 Tax=Thiomonas sp. FB-Cd TaxID=1158292 RepID=UPI001E38159F|nr:AIPR family protein [Thiomonas sp. FB-Cd]